MDLSAVVKTGDFNAGEKADVMALQGLVEAGDSCDGIMISERCKLHLCFRQLLGKQFRRILTITEGRMAVEIDAYG